MTETIVKRKKSKRSKLLSVNYTDNAILRDILKIYLPKRKTFDCDLTFGLGGFYSGGIKVPKHIYDKYQFGENSPKSYVVKSLEEVKSLDPECFESVVVDLPVDIEVNVNINGSDFNACQIG